MPISYETVKYVSIQDSRLGLLRYLLLLAIVVYVGVFEMWAFGGWLTASPVVGVVRFSLQQPTVNGCDPAEDESCRNDFQSLDQLPYCTQSTNSSYQGSVYSCEIYEAINAQMVTEKSMVVLTRASTAQQTLVCGPLNMTCPRTYETAGGDNHKFYIAQSEAFTVLLDHAVTASKICREHSGRSYACSAESSQYNGRLYSNNPELCHEQSQRYNASFAHYRGTQQTPHAPCYIQPNRTVLQQDFFSLDVLLRAAGVTLDDCVNETATADCHQTYRDSGATLLLNIFWSDFVSYNGKVEPHYYYSPHLVGKSFKLSVPYYELYRQRRTVLNAHGIRIAVLLGGEFHQFEIVAFLVTLTTALGLLAVATTVVDSLMLYILPERGRYQEVKFESTEEMFEGPSVQQLVSQGLSSVLGPAREEDGPNASGVSEGLLQELHPDPDGTLTQPLLQQEGSATSSS